VCHLPKCPDCGGSGATHDDRCRNCGANLIPF
jgi:DnaJ-class molecular chaperone